MELIEVEIESYAHDHTEPEGELLARLEKETRQTLEMPQMLTGRIEGRFLKMLALLIDARRILEIGTFSGYATLSMAEALPTDGEIITCDKDPVAIAVARRYFAESQHGAKITLREGPALATLASLQGPFDMAFIDADKENYQNYYEAILPLARSGSLIVVDNVLWSGRVLDPQEASDRAIDAFNQQIKGDERVDRVLLTVRDGIFCLRKR